MQETDWQTWAAPGVVLATLVVFGFRLGRRKKHKAGCQQCDSDKKCD
jgi:hypothetical protein